MSRSYKPFVEGFWEKVGKGPACWLWLGARRGGRKNQYGNYRGKMAHRVSWEITTGKIEDGMFVLHKCDTPLCVNPDHLFLGSLSDNAKDMYRKGRKETKLSLENARRIRLEYSSGCGSMYDLAARYGLSPTHVCNVINGKARLG